MEYSQDIAGSYDRLKVALGDLVEGWNPEIVVPQDDDNPMLVLETAYDSVGFTIVTDKPEISYSSAYDSFKHLYRQNHASWKERNLSFVVCRSEPEFIHDAFYSSIETDAYFCRKYVLSLQHNRDDLDRELMRLPFIPLLEGRTGGILRPPPAQTLLQNINVRAQLARQIIVPQEYSAKNIVNKLLTQKEPLPVISRSSSVKGRRQSNPIERTRVKSLEIEAFRAYRKKQKFDLDADVVVFYGPNGLGKTSFFDAFDYACTGRIGRLCQRRISQNGFIDLARHLSSSAGDGYVSMEVAQGGKIHSIGRKVDDWSTALIDNVKYNRANTLQFLTSAEWKTTRARIENIERLFRATHLFGQSDSELLVEFEKNSTLSPEIVHRMLALDDYASGLAKTSAVLTQLDKQISENERKTSDIAIRVDEVQIKIDEIPATQDTSEINQQLMDVAVSLVKDLQQYINVTIVDSELNRSVAREWRAMTDSAYKDVQDRFHSLQNVESGFAQFAEEKSALKQITEKLSNIKNKLKQNISDQKDRQKNLNKLTINLEHERATLSKINSQLNNFAELESLQEVFLKTKSSLQHWQMEIKRVVSATDETIAELQPLLPLQDNLHNNIAELSKVIQDKIKWTEVFTAIRNNYSNWLENREIILNLQKSIDSLRSVLLADKAIINELNAKITTNENNLEIYEKEYENHTSNQLELTRLLDEIEEHVVDSFCPTCGVDHKSNAAVIEKIHAQKQTRPANIEALAKNCRELRKTLKQDKALLEIRIKEQESKNDDLNQMENKFAEANKFIIDYEKTVTETGFAVDNLLVATIDRKLEKDKTIRQSSQKSLTIHESKLAAIVNRIKELKQKRGEQADALKLASNAALPLEEQIATLRAKAEILGVPLEMPLEELKAETEIMMSHKARLEEHIIEFTRNIKKLELTVIESESQISEMDSRIKNLGQDKERLERTLQLYKEKVITLIDDDDFSQNGISEQRELAFKTMDSLDKLRRRCINFERTVDAGMRSVLLAELKAEAQLLAKQKQTFAKELKLLSSVKMWFTSVKESLHSQSSSAVANHIEAFGPLSTLIQKRLRAVYGFGDVRLLAKGGEIRVEVGWKSAHVKPADYFSDSQKQILMLSIFLAGRLTQTWSGFAPILMDDPVTHFDDLNAFGFIELVRGLISTSPGKRQFFISTCEDRLFRLMLKKFNNVEGGAKFYKFEGIGYDGPIIRQQN